MVSRKHINFGDSEPIMIAKAANIESYWTQAQKRPSKRICIDPEGSEIKQIFTSIHPDSITSPDLMSKIGQEKKDLLEYEEQLKSEMIRSQEQFPRKSKAAVKVRVFDIPKFSPQNRSSAQFSES